ncbi:hypothetical protein ACFL9U_17835 [Thermodesulfobacteriota bacterium]
MCAKDIKSPSKDDDNSKPKTQDFVTKELFSKIATIFGITNISALIIAFVYVFFVLPGEATDKALNMIETTSYEKVQLLQQKLMETYSNSLILSGENKEEIEQNVKETAGLKTLIGSLKLDLENITKDDVLKVKELSDQLKEGAALDRLNKALKKVENIEKYQIDFYDCVTNKELMFCEAKT